MEYIVGGNVMLDRVRFADGSSHMRESIGGPATFAYSGIKLFTDNVLQCSNVGADYATLFHPWMEKNGVEAEGMKVVCDRCNHSLLVYNEDGTYGRDETERPEDKWLEYDAWQDFGYMKTTPEELAVFTSRGDVKGIYMAQNVDHIWWGKLVEIKKRDGFKMMWEIEGPYADPHFLERVKEICRDCVDVFSINIQEAEALFRVKGDEACIAKLQELEVDVTLFRVGACGAYSVTPTAAYYLPPAPGPVVDPTGCGNTSTGSALYAYCEGMDPLKVGIVANVGSSMNIRQFGVIEDFAAVRGEAWELVDQLYAQYSAKYLTDKV